MGAGRDLLLFIGFLIVLGIAWFVTGGPARSISHQGWFLSAPSPLGNAQDYNIPHVPLPNAETESQNNTTPPPQTNPVASIWDYFFNYRVGLGAAPTPGTSSYAQNVYFQQGNSMSADPTAEYVIIRTSPNLKTNLTITGWTVESAATGAKATIGNAAVIPYLGQVNSEGPISIGPNTSVYLTTGHSPNGTSFRLNECTGYFEQFQHFTPSLQRDCPRPEDELLRHPQTLAGNDTCDTFIRSIPQCTLTLTAIPGNVGSGCQDFILNDLSYSGCITAHKNDPNFYRSEWRVFLERDQELWKNTHDVIRLLDENGKLVGQVSY